MGFLATVIIPTYDHGLTLRYALASALSQTVQDLEVVIIGDGVTGANKRLLGELAAADSRVRVVNHPKHESRGEPYRHEALQEARGKIVCYLCDRDLWLPSHVERLLQQLESADFTHSLPLHVSPTGGYRFFPCDLSISILRQYMGETVNRVPLSCAAHTIESYRKLPFGWRVSPPGVPTDWYMFQQFLRMEECRASSGTYPSAITFPSPSRPGWSTAQRVEELMQWAQRIAHESTREKLVLEILQEAIRGGHLALSEEMRATAELRGKLSDLHGSLLWRFRETLLGIPILPRLVRSGARKWRKFAE